MKNKFLLIAVSVFFLSSCSDMRYAGMQKVKQNPSATIAQNENEKISTPEIKAIQPKNEEVVLNNSEVNSVVINENNKTFANKTPKKSDRFKQSKTKKTINNTPENPTKISQKNALEHNQTINQSHIEKGSWLWYIIVGLVFLLIGSIITGIVGNILWIVGIVLLVYGLLVLLEVL